MKRLTLILITALLFPIGCLAADKDAAYETWVLNNFMSCEEFVAARNECKQGDCTKVGYFKQWLSNYFTSHNKTIPDTAAKDMESQFLWLDNFCRKNPAESFNYAVDNLRTELYPTRTLPTPRSKK